MVYNLEGHLSRIKENIEVKIGQELEANEKGIGIEYLDSIYQEDEMSDAWTKYKNFQKVSPKQDIPNFIAELEKEYLLAKQSGCEFSDTILATNLSESI